MANCCVVNCSNSYYQLQRWMKSPCDVHIGKRKENCGCEQPFKLLPFPTEKTTRAVWIRNVNRKDGKGNWNPKKHTRICSEHFREGKPTSLNPYPVVKMGYDLFPKQTLVRRPPKIRSDVPLAVDKETDTDVHLMNNISLQDCISIDHQYAFAYHCDCSQNCACSGCIRKELQICRMQEKIRDLERQIETSKTVYRRSFIDFIPNSDKKVRLYLGLPNRQVFNKLLYILKAKCKNLKYWKGQSKIRIVSTKVKKSKQSEGKPGPTRKLSVKHEFMLTLLKLRLNLTLDLLSDFFGISLTVASQTFTTWVKFLSHVLKNLIYHPSKEEVKKTLPECFKKSIPNVRGIIDCSEMFIEKPNSLDIQVATWSDYKQHNTVKVLLDISPTGIIQFKSKAWGGRVSDKHIVNNSGYLETIEPGDVILADRGFPIAEELMLRRAHIYSTWC